VLAGSKKAAYVPEQQQQQQHQENSNNNSKRGTWKADAEPNIEEGALGRS